MSVVRRFLVAPSLVRLIRKERGGARITEGYFAPQAGRTSYVRVDGQQCHLVLVTTAGDGSTSEERTDVPRAHGDALLDVCSGKAAYDRTVLALGEDREALVDRYSAPGALDLISLAFPDTDRAGAFVPPAWFGPEVTANAAYDRHAVALEGVPQPAEIVLSNAALEALLDLLEPRFGFGRYNAPPKSGEDEAAIRARRRAASAAATAKEPEPAVAEPVLAAPEPEPVAIDALDERAAAAEPEAAVHPAPGVEQPAAHSDARIEDVIESLSQALGGVTPRAAREPAARDEDVGSEFERWTVRPRRTQQQN